MKKLPWLQPKRSDWIPPPIFEGKVVFIIGGGPSLKGFDYNKIKKEKVIGTNAAFKLGSWVDVCYFGDLDFWQRFNKELNKWGGIKVTSAANELSKKWPVFRILRGEMWGIDPRPHSIAWNLNTGSSAINLAYHFGAEEIVLLGFDMKMKVEDREKKMNWHDYYSKVAPQDNLDRYLKTFKYIAKDAQQLGLKIINANTDSAIREFPKVDFDDYMKGKKSD